MLFVNKSAGLLIQKVYDLLLGDADLPSDPDASDLPGPHQLIGGVPADTQDGHQVLHPEGEGQLVKGVVSSLQGGHPFLPTPGRYP